MSSAKEIKSKIGSIQSTKKITKAMQMVAASKMRRCQEAIDSNRSYAAAIKDVVTRLVHVNGDISHPFLEERSVERVGYIVISSDRGLCGGLNSNLFKKLMQSVKEWDGKEIKSDIAVVGSKAVKFCKRLNFPTVNNITNLGDKPKLQDVLPMIHHMVDKFSSGELDKIYVVYNRFVNTMLQEPVVETLIPISSDESAQPELNWDYIYEPSPESLLEPLIKRYIESQVYQCVIENIACEQAARMVAMKAATDNAGNLIDDLKLIYNKSRQAAITQELSEIVSGASAV